MRSTLRRCAAPLLAASTLALLGVVTSPAGRVAQASAASAPADAKPRHRYGWPMRSAGTYVGWSGARWSRDFGIASGRCHRSDIAAIVVAADGSASATAVPTYARSVGTLRGASTGVLWNLAAAADVDAEDRDCIGHALEIGRSGRTIVWVNPSTRLSFALTPGSENRSQPRPAGHRCRNYTIRISSARGGAAQSQAAVACQSEPGLWIVAP